MSMFSVSRGAFSPAREISELKETKEYYETRLSMFKRRVVGEVNINYIPEHAWFDAMILEQAEGFEAAVRYLRRVAL